MKKLQAILLTYLRAGAAAVLALYMLDAARPLKDYLAAGVAGIAGPLLKALDKSSPEFGLGAEK